MVVKLAARIDCRFSTPGKILFLVLIEANCKWTNDRIVEILTAATGGVGVILEHRYYGNTYLMLSTPQNLISINVGDSIPVTNFSTDSMRYII